MVLAALGPAVVPWLAVAPAAWTVVPTVWPTLDGAEASEPTGDEPVASEPDGAEATRVESVVGAEPVAGALAALTVEGTAAEPVEGTAAEPAAGALAALAAAVTAAEPAAGAEPADEAEPPETTELTIEDAGLAGAEPVEAEWLADAEAPAEPG